MQREHDRPCIHRPSIGFEFEIPLVKEITDCSYYVEDVYSYHLRQDDWRRIGFRTHVECGGLEVASPVHFNITQTRMSARILMDEIGKHDWLNPDRDPCRSADCGIHVHASVPSGVSHSYLSCLVKSVLNRKSSNKIWKFSGRKKKGHYWYQGMPSEWDVPYRERTTPIGNVSVRGNSPCGQSTLEYRLWVGKQDRLLPAIDFAHAFTRWGAEQLKDLDQSVTWSVD